MRLIRKYFFLIILLVISALSHWYIFFDLKLLSSGDWVFFFNSQAKTTLGFILYISSFDFGSISAFSNNWIFYMLFFLSSHLFGFTWDIFTRVIFLIPIVFLTPIFSFLLFRKVFKNNLTAFFSACIYSFNTFFLKLQLDWITYAFIWWLLPALFLSMINYLETKKNNYLIYNALLVFLGLVFELRIMILVLVFLTLFQIIFLITCPEHIKEKVKSSFYILLSIILGFLGHAYWIIPIKFSNIFGEVMNYASPNPFVSFYNIIDALTLHMYSWSYNFVMEPFIRQPVECRHFLIPIFAILGIVYAITQKIKIQKHILIFFMIVLPLFIFLGKQELKPFPNIYGWLFQHLLLFNLYRESGKFFILFALPLSFFFGLGLYYVYNLISKYRKNLAVVLCIFILFLSSIYNLEHFFDQKIGGMAKGVKMENDYQILEKKLSSDINFHRVLWIPGKPRFGFYSEVHPLIGTNNLIIIFKRLMSSNSVYNKLPARSQSLFFLQQNYSQQLLNNIAMKYIILPTATSRIKKISSNKTETVTEIYEHFGVKREFFIKELDQIPWLKKIDIGTKELVVYENEGYRPHIYTTGERETIYKEVPYKVVDFRFRNPTEYKISLKNISTLTYINFSEAFHQDWRVRVGEFDWFKVLTEKNYFIPNKYHYKNDAQLNSFLIDPNVICRDYECKKNPDGSYDLNLTLFFSPQSYFYLGLTISGLTLFGCLSYLVIYFVRSRKTKHPKHPKPLPQASTS